jgi:hypothetical protein
MAIDPAATVPELAVALDNVQVAIRERALELLRERGARAREALPAITAVLDQVQQKEYVAMRIDEGRASSGARDVTERVHRAAAQAILAIAAPDDPLVARAQAVLDRAK